ncbi:RING-type zinc finger protein [Vairimorpha necatrix]|uniref:RING-type zinc finger protein n=1 Tax=Vairimorpha necatrix TaxID=6039 RepID=A0AAX4J8J4_9MICR
MHKCKYCNFIEVTRQFDSCYDCQLEIQEFKISEDILELISHSYEIFHCSICLEDIKNEEIKQCLKCMTAFHKICIKTWNKLNEKCPICRHKNLNSCFI